MNTELKILELLEYPKLISGEETSFLKQEAEKYPYAQFLQALHLKSLDISDENYQNELEKVCSITANSIQLQNFISDKIDLNENQNLEINIEESVNDDSIFEPEEKSFEENLKILGLSHLFDLNSEKTEIEQEFIESTSLNEAEKSIDNEIVDFKLNDKESEIVNKIEIHEDVLENDNFDEEIETSALTTNQIVDSELSFDLDTSIDGFDFSNSIAIENNSVFKNSKPKITKINIVNDKMKFEDWILLPENPSNNTINVLNPSKKIESKVITEFIEKNPKISPILEKKSEKITDEIVVEEKKKSKINNETIFEHSITETLASLYKEQNKFEKAIQAYNILSLKYPEKSIYFANLINDIKNLKK